MLPTLLLLAAPLLAPAQDSRPTKAPTIDHRPLTALLERHVEGELVDYAGLERDRALLDAYLAKVEAVTPQRAATWTDDERFAFWVNTYNAGTLRVVLDHYRQDDDRVLDSITSISFRGPGDVTLNAWKQPVLDMAGFLPDTEGLTLDQVENAILRPTFGDERVHAAVNCASIGCPPLRAEAFTAAELDRQLDEQQAAFLAGPRNRFDRKAGVVQLSKIFEWYGEDFVDERAGTDLADWLVANGPASAGATAAERAWIREARIGFLEYDWALNDIERER